MAGRRRLHRQFGLIVEGGALAALVATGWARPPEWIGLVVFGVLCLGAEWAEVSLPGGILSTSFAVIYPAFILYGWPAAAIVALVSFVIAGRLQKRQRGVVMFNAGQIVLSIYAGSLLYRLAGGVSGPGAVVSGNALPLILFPLGYFIANHMLVGTYFTLRLGQFDWLGTWLEPMRWDLLNFVVAVPLGIVVAQLYGTQGLTGALLLFIPFFAVAYIFRLSVRLSLANRELKAFQGFSEAISASLELDSIFASIATALTSMIPHDACVLLVWDEAEQALVCDGHCHPAIAGIEDLRLKPGEGITGSVAKAKQPEIVADTRRDQRGDGLLAYLAARSLLAVPLVSEQRLIGVLVLGKRDAGAFSDRHRNLMLTLAGPAAVAVEKGLHHRETEALAVTDVKTGLYNYRFFIDQLSIELERARRQKTQLSLIYLDIDHFRETNNTFGHEAADGVLRDVTAILRRCVRDSDLAARYGGEEFVIMLPRAGSRDAQAVAERIRRSVERTIFRDRASSAVIRVTLSAGVSTFPEDGDGPSELVYKADLAMLRGAKEKGRNRVAVYAGLE
ncbi:MAG: diguanylate cyclase [Chloroflexota bacterium]